VLVAARIRSADFYQVEVSPRGRILLRRGGLVPSPAMDSMRNVPVARTAGATRACQGTGAGTLSWSVRHQAKITKDRLIRAP